MTKVELNVFVTKRCGVKLLSAIKMAGIMTTKRKQSSSSVHTRTRARTHTPAHTHTHTHTHARTHSGLIMTTVSIFTTKNNVTTIVRQNK